jgi:ectoine hydroxylase-related dioxygenase (phytanoyl-CoA dioxygenase family)
MKSELIKDLRNINIFLYMIKLLNIKKNIAMDTEDITETAKKEFSSQVNKQKGEISLKVIENPKFLTDDQKDSWNNNGFILLKNFCSEDTCSEMNSSVIDIINTMVSPKDPFSHAYAKDGYIGIREMKPNPEAKTIHDEMSKIFRLHGKGVFNEFINNKRLLDFLEDILGENIDCFLSQYIFKNPGAWGQPWHQDSSYFPFDRYPQVGAWIATSPATIENGCLVILPGSHQEHLHEHLPDDREGSNYGYTEIKDQDFSNEIPLTLETGDLLLFHSFLMHKSYDNKSRSKRTAVVFHFAETGTDYGQLDSPTNEWISVRGSGLN